MISLIEVCTTLTNFSFSPGWDSKWSYILENRTLRMRRCNFIGDSIPGWQAQAVIIPRSLPIVSEPQKFEGFICNILRSSSGRTVCPELAVISVPITSGIDADNAWGITHDIYLPEQSSSYNPDDAEVCITKCKNEFGVTDLPRIFIDIFSALRGCLKLHEVILC